MKMRENLHPLCELLHKEEDTRNSKWIKLTGFNVESFLCRELHGIIYAMMILTFEDPIMELKDSNNLFIG